MRYPGRTVENELADAAGELHGLVTRRALLTHGVTPSEIQRRIARGLLLIEYKGVYRVGHRAPSLEAHYMAAVLAGGDGAALGGAAAACLWNLTRGTPPPPHVVTRTERRIEGVVTQRARSAGASDITRWRGVPVTTVARTLVDLAAVMPAGELARVCHEASVRYRTTPSDVEAVLVRRPRSKGAAALRSVLHGDEKVTLSGLERAFLALLAARKWPLPLTNRMAGGRYVDCRWPDRNLTVELDSYRYHASRHAWELDRRREREARARGDDFRRYTYGDVSESPALMIAELRVLLTNDPA